MTKLALEQFEKFCKELDDLAWNVTTQNAIVDFTEMSRLHAKAKHLVTQFSKNPKGQVETLGTMEIWATLNSTEPQVNALKSLRNYINDTFVEGLKIQLEIENHRTKSVSDQLKDEIQKNEDLTSQLEGVVNRLSVFETRNSELQRQLEKETEQRDAFERSYAAASLKITELSSPPPIQTPSIEETNETILKDIQINNLTKQLKQAQQQIGEMKADSENNIVNSYRLLFYALLYLLVLVLTFTLPPSFKFDYNWLKVALVAITTPIGLAILYMKDRFPPHIEKFVLFVFAAIGVYALIPN